MWPWGSHFTLGASVSPSRKWRDGRALRRLLSQSGDCCLSPSGDSLRKGSQLPPHSPGKPFPCYGTQGWVIRGLCPCQVRTKPAFPLPQDLHLNTNVQHGGLHTERRQQPSLRVCSPAGPCRRGHLWLLFLELLLASVQCRLWYQPPGPVRSKGDTTAQCVAQAPCSAMSSLSHPVTHCPGTQWPAPNHRKAGQRCKPPSPILSLVLTFQGSGRAPLPGSLP